jgi:hypothetical protein
VQGRQPAGAAAIPDTHTATLAQAADAAATAGRLPGSDSALHAAVPWTILGCALIWAGLYTGTQPLEGASLQATWRPTAHALLERVAMSNWVAMTLLFLGRLAHDQTGSLLAVEQFAGVRPHGGKGMGCCRLAALCAALFRICMLVHIPPC